MRRALFVALSVGFLFFGISAYMQSKGAAKNKRIYQAVHRFSPWYLEKRIGGLTIRSKTDKDFKEKPSNMEVFHRFDALEKQWAQTHLTLENNTLIIRDDNGTTLETVPLKTDNEKQFVHVFYGL